MTKKKHIRPNTYARRYYSRARRYMRPWSAFEVRELRRLARKKRSARLIAGTLGRPPGAVRYKAMTLGIKFRSIKRTH